jgi:hypothetical protein
MLQFLSENSYMEAQTHITMDLIALMPRFVFRAL